MKYAPPVILAVIFLGSMFFVARQPEISEPTPLGAKPIDYQKLLTDLETEQGKFANACDFVQIINGVVADGRTFNVELPPGLTVNVWGGGLQPCGYVIRFETDTAYVTKEYGKPTVSVPKVASTTP